MPPKKAITPGAAL
jgi:hypothetical protein